jgi:hypothetical protein
VVKVENTSGINPVVCFFGGGVEGSITMSGQTEVYGNTTSSVAGADVDSPIGGVFSGSYFAPVPSSSSSVSTSGNVTVTLSGSASIRNNTGNGLVIGGALTMEDSASVHHNTGGGITISSEDNTNSVMRGNAAVHDNGAKGIYISGDGGDASRTQTFTMEGSATVYNNVGGESGAVYVSNDVSFTMRGSAKITGNTGCGALIMSGSAFIMEGNAEISNNNNTSGAKQGGGVYVSGNSGPSSFTMRDNAKITGNTASYGGGIFSQIHNLGEGNVNINIRDNAVISGNTASLSGGGVELEDTHSTYIIFFYMGGGTIFGNSEGANSNTVTAGSGNGAALYNYNNNAIARYGTFTGNTFTQNGGLTTRDTTIKVVGGALVP